MSRICCKCLGESPELGHGEHAKVVDDGIHNVEGQILFALLDIAKIEILAADPRRDSGLRLTLLHTELSDRQPENLPRSSGLSRVVSSDRFGHEFIVAFDFELN